MNRTRHFNLFRWVFIAGGLLLLISLFAPRASRVPELEISQVLQMAEAGQLTKIEVRGDKLSVSTTLGEDFTSRKESSVSVLELLDERAARVTR